MQLKSNIYFANNDLCLSLFYAYASIWLLSSGLSPSSLCFWSLYDPLNYFWSSSSHTSQNIHVLKFILSGSNSLLNLPCICFLFSNHFLYVLETINCDYSLLGSLNHGSPVGIILFFSLISSQVVHLVFVFIWVYVCELSKV